MLNSQLEVINQAKTYLGRVTTQRYTEIMRPQHTSSAGAHIRHIIDHYQALIDGADQGLVDYDRRHRGDACESDTIRALIRFEDIESWLHSLDENRFQTPLQMRTEVSLSTRHTVRTLSSLGRELVFAGSHAVHHYAMIAQISWLQHSVPDASFGVAAATASYQRVSACAR